MRPSINIDVERREKLILGIIASVTAIYRYFAPQRQAKLKIGRNDPWRCGSGKKYKHFQAG